MANSPYHQLPDQSYMNINNPGGPTIWKVQHSNDDNWYVMFTWDCINWTTFPVAFSTVAAAQASLDTVIGKINSGTFPA